MGCGPSSANAGSPTSRPTGVEELPDEAVREQYSFAAQLGAGAFGTVSSVTTTESYSSTFAMKVLSKTAMEANGVLLCDAYREIEIALSWAAQHAAIVRHSRAIESASSLYLLMEPVAGGDLGQLINKAPYGMLGHGTSVRASLWWSEALSARLFQQLLAALAHLHAASNACCFYVTPCPVGCGPAGG